MDLRMEKTEKGILNAFLELRAHKPLEKITVKEICERACINKSTFYAHYADLYALSEAMETDVVRSVINSISEPVSLFERPQEFTKELFLACVSQEPLIQILFSGSRRGNLIAKIKEALTALILQEKPEYRDDPVKNILLSFAVYGIYHAFEENAHYGMDTVLPVLGEISKEIMRFIE